MDQSPGAAILRAAGHAILARLRPASAPAAPPPRRRPPRGGPARRAAAPSAAQGGSVRRVREHVFVSVRPDLLAALDGAAYCQLLGLYLGDGWMNLRSRGRHDLRIVLDSRYASIVEEAKRVVGAVAAGRRVTSRALPGRNAVVVACAWSSWPDLIPQHGPGRKHLRTISLEDWQRELVSRHPEPFLRGLIHSDGCRTVNRFRTTLPSGRVAEYAYARYFFSNLSADIRALFCESCDQLGVRWTQSNQRNISVAHRPSVARLDAFVGEKR